jgi:cephalosporin-C deacetylase-like acetyl esterase
MFREIGFATFELQSFNSRKVKSTIGEQISVNIARMIHDAYRAFDALVSGARIDTGKVAITGWSLGVPLFSAWEPLYL